MTGKTRIGELLLLDERIDPWVLTNALKEQPSTGQRLVSLLVSRALLDPDQGAMALSAQLGFPAALQRHLERRDPAMLELIPAELGRRWVVLPLARATTGALVVCARDPTPILQAALEHAIKTTVVLSVTPFVQLEKLVRAAYGEIAQEPPVVEAPMLADIGEVRFEDTPIPIGRGRTVSYMFERTSPELPVRAAPTVQPLDATLAEIDRSITRAAVERHVMAFAARRWRAALLVRRDGSQAVGVRGHGIPDPETFATPMGKLDEQLSTLLGDHASALVMVDGSIVGVLAVADPDSRTTTELDRLVDALGAAYVRLP